MPDIDDFKDVFAIDVSIAVGDRIEKDQTIGRSKGLHLLAQNVQLWPSSPCRIDLNPNQSVPMKEILNCSARVISIFTLGLVSVQACAAAPSPLVTDQQKAGYTLGFEVGKSVAQLKGNVDLAAFEAGIDEAATGKQARLDDKTREEIRVAVSEKIKQEQAVDRGGAGEKAKADGAAFLSENGKRPGVKTTPSGLQYEIIKEGSGRRPTKDSNVTVNYKGTLLDGTTFDSSYDRGQPATFVLSQVIPGWTEGVQLMTSGSKYKFYLPGSLAYGEQGAGAKIGPNQTLIFEVELLKVE